MGRQVSHGNEAWKGTEEGGRANKETAHTHLSIHIQSPLKSHLILISSTRPTHLLYNYIYSLKKL